MLLTTDLLRLLIISSYHAPSEGAKTNSYKSQIYYKTTSTFSLTAVVTFVEHPYNDESILVTGCQLFILFVPRDHLYCACKSSNQEMSDSFPVACSMSFLRTLLLTYNNDNRFGSYCIKLTTVSL